MSNDKIAASEEKIFKIMKSIHKNRL